MSTRTDTCGFLAGDLVRVADVVTGEGNMASYLPYHGEVVRVVSYWRNGYLRVEEIDRPGIGVCIDAKHLTIV
jgi:hypothetical protein